MTLYEPEAVMPPVRNLYSMRVARIALLQAEWKLSGTHPDRKPVEMSSRTAEVVRQQEDGSWRYIIDHAFASD